jgi:hypothetical protein
VVRLRWKCTGTPTAVNKHDYPMEYRVKDKRGEWHVQCNCIMLVTIKKAEERTQAELEVGTSYADPSESTVARVRGVTTLQALLVADARRDARRTGRIGARWKLTWTRTRTTRTTTTTAEVS